MDVIKGEESVDNNNHVLNQTWSRFTLLMFTLIEVAEFNSVNTRRQLNILDCLF